MCSLCENDISADITVMNNGNWLTLKKNSDKHEGQQAETHKILLVH